LERNVLQGPNKPANRKKPTGKIYPFAFA
jgi:hypothetical protein